MAHFKEFIPQAFAGGHSMILDAEVLLIDTNTSKPLPFGTLGVHKVSTFSAGIFFGRLRGRLAPSVTPRFFRFRKRRFKTRKCASSSSTAFISTASASWTSECSVYERPHSAFVFSRLLLPVVTPRGVHFLSSGSLCFPPRPLCERRKFLHDNMVEVPNRILFSEMKHVTVRLRFFFFF